MHPFKPAKTPDNGATKVLQRLRFPAHFFSPEQRPLGPIPELARRWPGADSCNRWKNWRRSLPFSWSAVAASQTGCPHASAPTIFRSGRGAVLIPVFNKIGLPWVEGERTRQDRAIPTRSASFWRTWAIVRAMDAGGRGVSFNEIHSRRHASQLRYCPILDTPTKLAKPSCRERFTVQVFWSAPTGALRKSVSSRDRFGADERAEQQFALEICAGA